MELNEVAANLDKHEAVCAERWKTAFNKFSDVVPFLTEQS